MYERASVRNQQQAERPVATFITVENQGTDMCEMSAQKDAKSTPTGNQATIVDTVKRIGIVQTAINKFWGKAYRNKAGIIQAALDKLGARTYLEIGVASGDCFLRIKAQRKIAVDPAPESNFRSRICSVSLAQPHLQERLHEELLFEMTSDEFFAHHAALFTEQPIDVVLIDGLHTYAQSLQDVLNCLAYLSPKGVIVLHDCNPASETIGYPVPSFEAAERLHLPDWNNHWSGDVWKTIVHLRACRDDLQAFVLDCDMGVGIVSRKKSTTMLRYSVKDVEKLSYRDLDQQRKRLLNLKHPRYFYAFLARLHGSR